MIVDEKMQVTVFRHDGISYFVSGVQMSRAEKGVRCAISAPANGKSPFQRKPVLAWARSADGVVFIETAMVI